MIRVTNIERFVTHDGPGIRTTVFLKGCPMYCPWCANPETQTSYPELSYNEFKCIGCRSCEKGCRAKAITFDDSGKFNYNRTLCTDCLVCVKNCMQDALEFHGKDMELDFIMEEVMKDKDYYDNSNGGGITISGGEPFVQLEGLIAILKASRERGLNTAVETTGNYSLKTLQAAEPYIDHFLYDFKHLDDEVLKKVTGGNGRQIKENLIYLAEMCPNKLIVRMPIIPGFNFDSALIKKTLRYLQQVGVKNVSLLPYHILGKAKYEKLGRVYQMTEKMLNEEDLEEYHQYALKIGMKSKIGG
ncbi:glycyl-radical enzyme activating protein [Lacrimispora sp.]|uniref:glycyl-radical enzyme activating protein n=1 Tax=Lacrimispora sp. TaxID=2719234 RepID=UPI00345F6F2F